MAAVGRNLMRKLNGALAGVILCFALNINAAQLLSAIPSVNEAPPDSIVQVTAENDGLSLIAREDLPLTGTFWLITSNGYSLPMPCAPLDQSLPIYAISDNVFLADGTGGLTALNPHREGYNTVAGVLAAQANAVENLVSQNEMRPMMRAMGMDASSPFDGFSLGTFTNDAANYTWDTNQLWLEITNVTPATTFANLHHATNQVYAIWSTTDLATPLNQWQVATEFWPTDTNCQPFTVQNFGGLNQYLRAEDWTDVDSDGDGIPDWWIWNYFGDLSETATNLDTQGNTFGYDYANHLDPNVISFTVRLGNQNFNTLTATGSFVVVSGVPSYEAVLVNDTNLADAIWQPYDGSITMNLGSTDGVYSVTLGLKGRAADSQVSWIGTDVTLNRQTPQITITSPTNGIVAQPWLQLQGYATLPLDKVTYDLNDVSNQLGSFIKSTIDTNTFSYTTDYFECCDLLLNEGTNRIALHATDPAGNVFTTNLTVVLDFNTATNPVIQLTWPQNDMKLCGDSFTLRGWTEDAAALVNATITDRNGDTNTVSGIVSRDGKLWVQNIPLNSGTNFITLTVTNTAGLSSATNFMVVKSDMTLALTSVDGDLWLPTVAVNGVISDTNAPVWCNGVQGTNNGDGTWRVDNVPVSEGGIASFDMSTLPPGAPDPNNNTNLVKQDELVMESAIWHMKSHMLSGPLLYEGERQQIDGSFAWGQGGHLHSVYQPLDLDQNVIGTTTVDSVLSSNGTFIVSSHLVDSWGTDITDTNASPFVIAEENGSFTHTSPGQGWSKSSTVKMVLHTGGIGLPGSQVLVEADGTVAEEWPISSNLPPTEITAEQVGQLDDSGSAYGAFKDGKPVRVTHKASPPMVSSRSAAPTYRLTHETWFPALTDTNLARLNIGVGEYVDLKGMPNNTVWTGPGLPPTTNSGVTFIAPSNAVPTGTKATVSAYIPNTATMKAEFTVFPPTSATSVIRSTDTYPAGDQGAGMHLRVTWHPTNVSFYRVQMLEVSGPATNITGYFTNYPASEFWHSPNTNWVPLTEDNSWLDHSACAGYPPPWVPGGFDRDIPVQWRIDEDTNVNNFPHELAQKRITSTDGTTTVTKLGSSTTRTP